MNKGKKFEKMMVLVAGAILLTASFPFAVSAQTYEPDQMVKQPYYQPAGYKNALTKSTYDQQKPGGGLDPYGAIEDQYETRNLFWSPFSGW